MPERCSFGASEWLQRTQVERQRKLAEDIIRQRVNLVSRETLFQVRVSLRIVAHHVKNLEQVDEPSCRYQIPRIRHV